MLNNSHHTFHIPVMGLGFTIDTPVKVAHLGISSVISIMEDGLIENMRKFYHEKFINEDFVPITNNEDDYRAKRITAYLNLVNDVVTYKFNLVKQDTFGSGGDLDKYFELLPEESDLKKVYLVMLQTTNSIFKSTLIHFLKSEIIPGNIDVNIMSKLDKLNFDKNHEILGPEYADAMAALRGFAKSNLKSSVIFSAGFNPRLYAYLENFEDFLPNKNGEVNKKVILKVSDFRSAVTQSKFLAKKGIFVSEFRIESGLNCGGHAFATEGLLMGPILEEFKLNRKALEIDLSTMCNQTLQSKCKNMYYNNPELHITYQGGIGSYDENELLIKYYHTQSNGWGSPFLLVPEVTNVDDATLKLLQQAKPDDYYLSHSSPMGIPFNNFRLSSSEQKRKHRIFSGKPGSPCYRKFLSSNTEFTKEPICTASRQYQKLKINQLEHLNLKPNEYNKRYDEITEKDCLCTGLASSVLKINHISSRQHTQAVAICPGPNLAYFTGIFTLNEMVDHIYGRTNILNQVPRSNLFINELKLYIDYLVKEVENSLIEISKSKINYLNTFKNNLVSGIRYYKCLNEELKQDFSKIFLNMKEELNYFENKILNIRLPILQEISE